MWTIGIDIGGTFIKSALVKDTLVKEKRAVATPKADQQALLQLLVELIQDYQKLESIQAVGIAVPGTVKEASTVFHGGAVAYLNGVNLKQKLQEYISLDIFVENDAKAAVLGEASFGNLQSVSDGAAVILGTGVGVGLWLEGKVRKGPHFQAGEASFLIHDQQFRGAESFVGVNLSAVLLVKKLATILKCPEEGAQVFEQMQTDRNEAAEQALASYCQQVALLCFNLQCLLDLEKIVLGGGISQQATVIERTRQSYETLRSVSPITRQTIPHITIEAAKYQSDANLIGIAKGAKKDEISN